MPAIAKRAVLVAPLAAVLVVGGCGGTHLLGIQVIPLNPSLTSNNLVYISPASSIQYQVIGFYSDRTSQTIFNSQGRWSSTNNGIATVNGSGLATSVGPLGVTTIVVTVSGHRSTSTLAVCSAANFCPP